jgi:hypothetical protein
MCSVKELKDSLRRSAFLRVTFGLKLMIPVVGDCETSNIDTSEQASGALPGLVSA